MKMSQIGLKKGSWKPPKKSIENQILILHRLCLLRMKWRTLNAVVFKDSLEYRFQFSETGIVEDVVIEKDELHTKLLKNQ